jgi:hypothetical protein
MDKQDGPVVLTLPEVPEGAVAMRGARTGTRYPRNGEFWGSPEDTLWDLADVLNREHPEGVTVEMAPPPAPRTAAEIWAAMRAKYAPGMPCAISVDLAEALDREAGLS